MSKLKRSLFHPLPMGFMMIIMIWYVLYLVIATRTIPAPLETFNYFFRHLHPLVIHMGASLMRVVVAVVLAILIGLPVGIAIGRSKRLDKVLSPLLYIIYPIPKVAFLPVFMLLFGLGNVSKVILMLFIIVFQLMLSVRDGVKDIPPHYFTVIRSFSARRKYLYRYVVLPAILPRIFSSLRISIGISLATLFFAENYATTYGIGYFILSAWMKMNYVEMFSGIIALSLLGSVLFGVIDMLEKRLTPWL
ncbi:NitT/TauT family transport system permease protein [Halolactibacillus halophilus]|uniref:ABC transporter permease n=1 Tax=Halolactibacillus halophilus TaxID=306540 RepID=A0A1I5RHP4_9BACI|nr:ABC transporter permease [Halolactibacillus halophilus]GEM02352.1 ABC transporter permease [Halolactibacillus halophilus]SFP57801.1 NitT/TauT family transport system permease protein [Halolactibacillus halophilus]